MRKPLLIDIASRHAQKSNQIEVAAIRPPVDRRNTVEEHLLVELVPHSQFHRRDFGEHASVSPKTGRMEQRLPPAALVGAVPLGRILTIANDMNVQTTFDAHSLDVVMLRVGKEHHLVIVLWELEGTAQHHLVPCFTLGVVFAIDASALAHEAQGKVVLRRFALGPADDNLRVTAEQVPVQVGPLKYRLQLSPPLHGPH